MTALDEDLLCSGNLAKRKLTLPKLLERIIVDDVDIDSILQCDVESILLNTRILNYGVESDMSTTCPKCGESSESKIALQFTPKMFSSTQFKRGNNSMAFTFPRTGKMVIFKLPTWKEHGSWKELGWLEFAKNITLAIDKVEDIPTFYDTQLSGYDSKAFREFYHKSIPGFTTTVNLKCPKCNTPIKTELDVTTDIFGIRPGAKSVIHDEIFSLCYNSQGGFTFSEVYEMPVGLRRYYIQKLIDTRNAENDRVKKQESEVKSSNHLPNRPPSISKPSLPSVRKS